jgi:hypothetical protein
MSRRRATLTALAIAAVAGLFAIVVAPRASRELRHTRGRLAVAKRRKVHGEVSIYADMHTPGHVAAVWTGIADEAEAVRERLPASFGRTWIGPTGRS